tara:strand:- start:1777 stop:1974 length:198 start_codon:yes stop_codon:yes gene_type:complete
MVNISLKNPRSQNHTRTKTQAPKINVSPQTKKKKCNKPTPNKTRKINITNRKQHEKTEPVKNEIF